MSDDKTSNVVGVATAGIQDVSALLPLLGTEQCEAHVTSALQRGYLYAAATPMSIFGSLGLVKAGFVVLWASSEFSWFSGPAALKNAGFNPLGACGLLLRADENRGVSVIEEKINRVLGGKTVMAVDVNLRSWDLWAWNIRLIAATFLLSGLGLLPYALLIYRLPGKSFQQTWLYPMIRILGCDLVAICVQIILQLRILEEGYWRIRFLATDSYLKREGYKEFPQSWDSNQRSKDVLDHFQRHVGWQGLTRADGSIPLSQSPSSGTPSTLPRKLAEALKDLGTVTSFAFSPRKNRELFDNGLYSKRVSGGSHHHYNRPRHATPRGHSTAEPQGTWSRILRVLRPGDLFGHKRPNISAVTTVLVFAQVALFASICAAIIGYIGCFTVVQSSPRSDSTGPAVWLALEAFLALLRTALWGWNPASDDAKPPIALHKVAAAHLDPAEAGNPSGVKWDLDSATTDDVHAVVIGIGEYRRGSGDLEDIPGCVKAAQSFGAYLKTYLRVPHDQVVTLFNADATNDRVLDEIGRLVNRIPVGHNAPVVIYLGAYLFLDLEFSGRILTYLPDQPLVDYGHCSLRYKSFIELLEKISREKTDNITVILDCCFAGRVRRPEGESEEVRFEVPDAHVQDSLFSGIWVERGVVTHRRVVDRSTLETKIDAGVEEDGFAMVEIVPGQAASPSYFLITTSRARLSGVPEAGSVARLTATLLDVLKHSALQTMTYGGLMASVQEKMHPTVQRASGEGGTKHVAARDFKWANLQYPIWTKSFTNRLLLDGLFARKIDSRSSSPVITVRYEDH